MPIFTAEERVGQLIAERYRLNTVLSTGGMGILFDGRDEVSGQAIAVKMLKPAYALEPDRIARFLRETKIAAKVRHPHIADVLDIGVDPGGAPFLVMELLYGRSLEEELKERGTLGSDEALAILMPIAEALVSAHAAGVVHRDVKPSNIFLSRCDDGRMIPKLLDFGIAKPLEDEFETQSGLVVGTPGYMPPEQAQRGECGPYTDVWAMAAVLYRCLAGRPPHCGSSVTEILVKLVKEPVPVLNVAGVPKPLCATIDRALARDPHRRYPSMSAFVHALKAAAGLESVEIGTEVLPVVVLGSLASSSNGPTDAQDTSLSEALDLPSREVSLLSKGSASEHDAGRRTRIRGAIALGALLAVGAVWLARNGHPAQVTPAAELRADVRRSPGSQPALLVAVPRPQSSAEPQSTAAAVEGSSVESRSAHARASAGPRTRSELPQAFKALLTKAPPRKRISATTLASEAPSSPEPARAQTAERERTTGLPVATEW